MVSLYSYKQSKPSGISVAILEEDEEEPDFQRDPDGSFRREAEGSFKKSPTWSRQTPTTDAKSEHIAQVRHLLAGKPAS